MLDCLVLNCLVLNCLVLDCLVLDCALPNLSSTLFWIKPTDFRLNKGRPGESPLGAKGFRGLYIRSTEDKRIMQKDTALTQMPLQEPWVVFWNQFHQEKTQLRSRNNTAYGPILNTRMLSKRVTCVSGTSVHTVFQYSGYSLAFVFSGDGKHLLHHLNVVLMRCRSKNIAQKARPTPNVCHCWLFSSIMF